MQAERECLASANAELIELVGERDAIAATPDVMRADAETRAAYEGAFGEVVEQVARGLAHLPPDTARQRALALLSLLSGGVTIARGMASAEQSALIGAALRLVTMEFLGGKSGAGELPSTAGSPTRAHSISD